MLRRHHLVVALSTAAAASEWHSCPLFSHVGNGIDSMDQFPTLSNLTAECLHLQVPVCYPGVCTSDNKTLSVFLKRLPATRPTTPGKAVWLMQGGPGAPSDAMELSMFQVFKAAKGTMSLYTMDHRGVGRSSRLDANCPELNGESDMGDKEAATAYSNCFQKLKDLYGAESPKGFSVTSAATDLASIIESPMLAKDDVYVYGVSYGTYLVERLMHLAPKNVKGYILDSMLAESPVSVYSDWDRDVAKVETTYYGLCDRDAKCSSKIGPNSKQFAFDLYKKLDANDTACAQAIYAEKGLPSDFLGSTFSDMLTNYKQRNLIPAILYRLAKCVADVKSEAAFLAGLLGLASEAAGTEGRNDVVPGDMETGESVSDDLLYHNIVFNEIWGLPSPSFKRLRDDAAKITWRSSSSDDTKDNLLTFCAFRGHLDPVCEKLGVKKQQQTFAYSHDQYWNKAAAIPAGASALLLSGAIDIQTIPKYAVSEYASMVGDKKLLLQFPFGGHSIISTTPTDAKRPGKSCGMDILNMYLQSGGNLKAIKTDCMKDVLPLDCTLIRDKDKALELFGTTTDLFGDEEQRHLRHNIIP